MLELAQLKNKDNSIKFTIGSAQQLPFEDHKFDRYIANYVLHLVPSAPIMLKEAKRVLKPGGIAVFSVWGRKEYCPQFTIVNEGWKKSGVKDPIPPNIRSSFYLCDIDSTKQLLLDAGFNKVFTWHSYIASEITTGDEFANKSTQGPAMDDKFSKLNKEEIEKYKQAIKDLANDLLLKGKPIGHEILYIVASV